MGHPSATRWKSTAERGRARSTGSRVAADPAGHLPGQDPQPQAAPGLRSPHRASRQGWMHWASSDTSQGGPGRVRGSSQAPLGPVWSSLALSQALCQGSEAAAPWPHLTLIADSLLTWPHQGGEPRTGTRGTTQPPQPVSACRQTSLEAALSCPLPGAHWQGSRTGHILPNARPGAAHSREPRTAGRGPGFLPRISWGGAAGAARGWGLQVPDAPGRLAPTPRHRRAEAAVPGLKGQAGRAPSCPLPRGVLPLPQTTGSQHSAPCFLNVTVHMGSSVSRCLQFTTQLLAYTQGRHLRRPRRREGDGWGSAHPQRPHLRVARRPRPSVFPTDLYSQPGPHGPTLSEDRRIPGLSFYGPLTCSDGDKLGFITFICKSMKSLCYLI